MGKWRAIAWYTRARIMRDQRVGHWREERVVLPGDRVERGRARLGIHAVGHCNLRNQYA